MRRRRGPMMPQHIASKIRFPPDQHRWLDTRATQLNSSIAAIVREAVDAARSALAHPQPSPLAGVRE